MPHVPPSLRSTGQDMGDNPLLSADLVSEAACHKVSQSQSLLAVC